MFDKFLYAGLIALCATATALKPDTKPAATSDPAPVQTAAAPAEKQATEQAAPAAPAAKPALPAWYLERFTKSSSALGNPNLDMASLEMKQRLRAQMGHTRR